PVIKKSLRLECRPAQNREAERTNEIEVELVLLQGPCNMITEAAPMMDVRGVIRCRVTDPHCRCLQPYRASARSPDLFCTRSASVYSALMSLAIRGQPNRLKRRSCEGRRAFGCSAKNSMMVPNAVSHPSRVGGQV